MCIGLIDTNPTQLERAQTTSYANISRSVHFAKHAKKMMTVQSVQCHVAADCTGRTNTTDVEGCIGMLTWEGC
jgi:hypothetical protein